MFGSQGAGTDDDVLIEILASRTGEQIKDIIKVYKKGDLLSCEGKKEKQINMFTVTIIVRLMLFVLYCDRVTCATMMNKYFSIMKSFKSKLKILF